MNRHDLTARADTELTESCAASGCSLADAGELVVRAEIPKMAVGKFDKKVLRASRTADELNVERL